MKKILLISYFYPPCNLTAAQRVAGWAKYLHESGYYPIVVTRNWDKRIEQSEDVLYSSGTSLQVEKRGTHEVHYVPYKPGLRDRIFTRLSGTKLQGLSKLFTALELIMENFSMRFIPHRNIYRHADKLLSEDRSIQQVIISGNPFNQFAFGYHLKKRHPIQWIADYRDDWNTSELEVKPSASSRLIAKLQAHSEKKWVGTAVCITSVSQHYVQKIAQFVNRPGYVVLNGYDFELPDPCPQPESDIFRITYNGSLYASQPIEVFLEAVKSVIRCNDKVLPIEVHFPGLAYDPVQKMRVEALTKDIQAHIFITARLPKEEVIDLQLRSDVLLMVAHNNIKGIPSSKLFEYIGLERTILVCPTDSDVIEEMVTTTATGHTVQSIDECISVLTKLIHKKRMNETLTTHTGTIAVRNQYSRRHQTKVLGELLDSITSV